MDKYITRFILNKVTKISRIANLLILLAFICSFWWMEIETKARNVIYPRILEACDVEDVKPQSEILHLKINQYSKKNFSMEVKIEIKRDFSSSFDAHGLVTKCNSYADEDSCEFYNKVILKKISCGMINMKNQLWSNLLINYEPPISCPFKKGIYWSKSLFLDANEASKWVTGLENHYWIVRLEVYDSKTKDKVVCALGGFDVMRAS